MQVRRIEMPHITPLVQRWLGPVRRCQLTSSRGKSCGDDFNQNFRFGPLTRASYASPALDATNLPPEQAPIEIIGVPSARLCRLTSSACRHANAFTDTAPTLLPRPPDFPTAIVVLSTRPPQT